MQRIFLVPHDVRWKEAFAREASAVAGAVGVLLVAIHHIGSTAIPGIRAKPILDILAVVGDIFLLDSKTPQLEALGYEAKGEFGISGRRYFRKEDEEGNRTHQIHAFQIGSPQIERHLAFREFMIAHPHHARQYEALKERLAELHPADISSYADGKDEFVRDMDAQAAAWQSTIAAALVIRPAKKDDAAALAELLASLGYQSTALQMEQRIACALARVDSAVFVADSAQGPLGLLTFFCIPMFHADGALGRITSLVVAPAWRGRGIGRKLVTAAEEFARTHGCARVEVTSGDHRADAHAFYERLGYRVDCRRFIKQTP